MKPKTTQCSFVFFYKELKRMQRTPRSFIKKGKERKEQSVLLYRTQKKAKNVPFFYKELKRTPRMPHSFIKNGKERRNVAFFWKERMSNPVSWLERIALKKQAICKKKTTYFLYVVYCFPPFFCVVVQKCCVFA